MNSLLLSVVDLQVTSTAYGAKKMKNWLNGVISVVVLVPGIAWSDDEVQEMESVVVVGQRAMMQNALSRQRNDDQIKSIVTRDAIGQFPDQNVAEAVRRLAGVNVLNDQGEGRFIAVRGLDPSLNGASINGSRVPSPESDSRAVALDVIPSELVESIEIIKTLTADMDADTIGAAIRINTTSSLQRTEPFYSVKVESSYNDLNEESSPKASVDFVYPFNDRLGVAGGFSYNDRDTSTDNIEAEGWTISDTGVLYADAIEYRDYDVNRERIGASLAVDYQFTDSTSLYARTLYSLFDDTEERRRLVFEMDEAPSSGSDNGIANFLSDDGEISVRRGLKDRFESQEIATFELGGVTTKDAWLLEYKASFARAEEEETDTQDPTRFRHDFDNPGELAVSFDYSDRELPTFSVTTGSLAFNNPATYEVNKIEQVEGLAEDDEFAFQLDITREISVEEGDLRVKFGGKARQREKQFDLFLQVFEDFSGTYTLANIAGQQSYDLFDLGPLPDLSATRDFNAANLSGFELNLLDTAFESSVEDYSVNEDVYAGYVMAVYELDNLTVTGGVRLERTENEMNGNLVELVEEDGTRNGVVLTEDTIFTTQQSFDNEYTDVLPSLSLRYNAGSDVVLRGGFFKSVVRPGISQLAPRFIVEEADDGEREGEFGNPELDPLSAWNYDLSAEWYFAPEAVVQLGVFYKEIDDFIVNAEFDSGDAPFNGVFNGIAFDEALIPLNGDEANVFGFEVAYQQALTQLPGPFDGLLLSANYTYTDTDASIGGRNIPLPAASKHNYNAMLGYEKGPFSVRLSATYRDEYLDELGGSADEDRYVKDHLQVDLSSSLRVTDNVRVYAQFVNLNDEPYVAFQKGPNDDRLLQYEEYSWTAKLGIQATF
jgi:TonB-dependent receptor